MIALDGKTLRRSHDHAWGSNALYLVSAWSTEQHLMSGQQRVVGHSNEITALPQLLALKANQKKLYQEVRDCFALGRETGWVWTGCEHHEVVNGGHGRVEKRRYWSIWDPEHLAYLDGK